MKNGIIKLSEATKKAIVAVLHAIAIALIALSEYFGWSLGWWVLAPVFSEILGIILGIEWIVPARVERQLKHGDGTDRGGAA